MLQWIGQHSGALAAIANFGMLVIWGVYLQLFWRGFNRQLRANILINRGAGSGLDARCLVSNMSSEAVFIEAVILVLRRGQEEWSSTTTSLSGMEGGDGAEPGEIGGHKGPLASGSYTDIGHFRELFERAFTKVPGVDSLKKERCRTSTSSPSG